MCLLLLGSETGVVWLTEKWFCWLRKDGKLGFVFVSLMCLCDVLSVFERKRVRGMGIDAVRLVFGVFGVVLFSIAILGMKNGEQGLIQC